eukprot:jgi/Hompol1/3159/HPOL_003144-RA
MGDLVVEVAPDADLQLDSTRDRRNSGGKAADRERDRQKLRREKERRELEKQKSIEKKSASKAKEANVQKNVYLPEAISVSNLGTLLGVNYEKLASKMKRLGFASTESDYVLNQETASLIVMEFNMNPIVVETKIEDLEARPEPEDWSVFPLRPPVVTIMGHVDHGKTTLLDSLRKTSVAAGEAGGITQHIGAFSVVLPSGKRITFLDTPGHAAFSAMRERGAQTTDIVVLVVAADDGVMPQTIEAIKHSSNAKVPIIVALNKCDKPGIDLRKVKESLLRYDVILEEYGGEIPAVEVSGLTGKGLDELEETILTVSEVMDLRGDPEGPCEATVIESQLNRERGYVATMLVQRGTLRPGDVLLCGNTWCKARRLMDENGEDIEQAGPSTPVQVMGWKELPNAGDLVLQAESEAHAKRIVQNRERRQEQLKNLEVIEETNERRAKDRITRQEQEAAGKNKTPAVQHETDADSKPELRLIIKADVHGSLEAIQNVIQGLPTHEVAVTVTSSGVGPANMTDVTLAQVAKGEAVENGMRVSSKPHQARRLTATAAKIIEFNLPSDRKVFREAKTQKVDIRPYNIIYKMIDDIKELMSELLPPDIVKEVTGEAEVMQVFQINTKAKGLESVAGCKIINGRLLRTGLVRVIRQGETILEKGTIKTFKHHKKDITEANKGLECGIGLEGFTDYQQGDIIQAFKVTEVRRKIQ